MIKTAELPWDLIPIASAMNALSMGETDEAYVLAFITEFLKQAEQTRDEPIQMEFCTPAGQMIPEAMI